MEKRAAIDADDFLSAHEIQQRMKKENIEEFESVNTTLVQDKDGNWVWELGRHNIVQ